MQVTYKTPNIMYEGKEYLSNVLAAAPLQKHKQILGEYIYPLVYKQKVNFNIISSIGHSNTHLNMPIN